jgi:hypothetical protein
MPVTPVPPRAGAAPAGDVDIVHRQIGLAFLGMTNGTATPSSSDTFSRISRSVRSRTPTI